MPDAVQLNPDTLIPMSPAPAPQAAPAAPTPPAAPAPAAKTFDAATGEEVEEGTEGQQPSAGGRKPIQPRINELTRARHDAEREAAYWKGVATAKSGNPAGTPAEAPAPAAPPKPTADKFQTYDEYVDALTDWKADRAVEKALAATNKSIEERSSQQTAAQRQESLNDNWAQRQEAIKKVIPDYDNIVAESDVPIAPHVGELLLESDHGPAIAYKIALDPSIADKLNKLSPTAAAKEIGKMEAAFDHDVATAPAQAPAEAPSPAAPAAPVKPVSKAPAPPNTLPQSTARQPDLAKMGMDDYVKARKAQGARWGR